MLKYFLLVLFIFFSLLSCGKKAQSGLEKKCDDLVNVSEEFIRNLPSNIESSDSKNSLLENLSDALGEAGYLSNSLFECQTSLLKEGKEAVDVRDSVISAHMKIVSVLSILDVYKGKVNGVSSDELSDLIFRLSLNIKILEKKG